MEDGDVVVFMNFRADRARQMTRALTDPAFAGFDRERVPRLAAYVCLTSYGDEFARLPIAFPPQTIANSFGEYICGPRASPQLRIAETEKYAHVTYFFNGGVEHGVPGRGPHPGPFAESRDVRPEARDERARRSPTSSSRRSRRASTTPSSATTPTATWSGHTGNYDAAVKAVETLDACIGRVVAAARAVGGEVLITADHGNAEMMHDPATGQAHTAHTLNRVPFVYVGRPATVARRRRAAGPRADHARVDGIAAAARDDRALAGPAGAGPDGALVPPHGRRRGTLRGLRTAQAGSRRRTARSR